MLPFLLLVAFLAVLRSFAASSVMKAAMTFIKKEEGLRLTPYKDGKGVSIGYGRNFPDAAKCPERITKEIAEEWLKEDVIKCFEAIEKYVVKRHLMSKNSWVAFASFLYNLGVGKVQAIASLVNMEESDKVIYNEWVKYHYANGSPNKVLKARRMREAKLFLSGYKKIRK